MQGFHNFFCDIFEEWLDSGLSDRLRHGILNRVDVDEKKGDVTIYISTAVAMPITLILETQRALEPAFKGHTLSIKNLLPKEAVTPEAILLFCEELSLSGLVVNGFLSAKPPFLDGESITIYSTTGIRLLNNQNLCERLGELICEKTAWLPSVRLEKDADGKAHCSAPPTPKKTHNVPGKTSETTEAPPWGDPPPNSAAQPMQASPAPPSPKKLPVPKKRGAKAFSVPDILGLDLVSPECELLMGRVFEPKNLLPLAKVGEQVGKMMVYGDVFEMDRRDGFKTILSIFITDGSGSCKMKIIANNGATLPNVSVGDTIFVKGDCSFDERYEKDYILFPNDIVKVVRKKKVDTAEIKRVELHLHTKMSSLDALISPKEVIKMAVSMGHTAVAITDHGNCQAFPQAMTELDKMRIPSSEFKLIYGMEGYFVPSETTKEQSLEGTSRTNHIILLAKTQTGLKNLYKLVSQSHLDYFYKRPRIPKWLLDEHRDGLIVGSACEAGELYRAMLEGVPYSKLMEIASYYDFLEVQPLGNNEFMLRNGSVESVEVLKEHVKTILKLGKDLTIPVIATGDVHFAKKEDAIYRTVLTAAMYKDADLQPPLYYRTTEEMLAEFDFLDSDTAHEIVVDNPNKLVALVDDLRAIPKGTYTPEVPGAEEDIVQLTMDGAKAIYGDPLPENISQRLERELDSIIKHGFAGLYVISQKLVKNSVDNGYLVGSRGSVGSSAVAFFSGISEVNPLTPHYICRKCHYYEADYEAHSGFDLPPKECPNCQSELYGDGHEIPFETFLGFDGDKAPDIDLNFSGEYQEFAHKYTEELFGSKYVFKAGTISMLQEKTAYGYVKKYLEERGLVVNKAEELRLCKGCVDVKKTTGQHPGGMVVVPGGYEVEDFTPVQYPSDSKEKGVITTHFEFKYLHDTILKLDILGHDMPTIFKHLTDMTGMKMEDVPMNDERVISLLLSPEALGVAEKEIDSKTGTFGIPELGTNFVRNMLIDAQPTSFSDLIQISGLSHGTDVWNGNAEDLIKNNICTISDVIGTRDSIMTELIRKGVDKAQAFKIMEWTRKGNAKKFFTPEIENMLRSCGVENWYIESCKKIQYMFPKAHAVAYLIAAVRLMWFKIYYPLEYYSVSFTVKAAEIFDYESAVGGKEVTLRRYDELRRKIEQERKAKDAELFTMLQNIREMLCRGYEFLPIELHKSHANVYAIEDGKIRLPYIALSGVGATAASELHRVCSERSNFLSVEELAQEAKLSSTVVTRLDEVGALSHLPKSSQLSLFD